MGKGDKRRPSQVDERTLQDRWAKTFGTVTRHEKKVETEEQPKQEDSK